MRMQIISNHLILRPEDSRGWQPTLDRGANTEQDTKSSEPYPPPFQMSKNKPTPLTSISDILGRVTDSPVAEDRRKYLTVPGPQYFHGKNPMAFRYVMRAGQPELRALSKGVDSPE